MHKQLNMLKKLEQVRSMQSQKKLAAITAEENLLRGQIETLKEHRRQSHDTDLGLMPMRAIGSDVLWQAWIDRTQKDLTIDLAKVMARKMPIARRAQKDIGRKEVANEMAEKAHIKERQEEEAKRLSTMLDLATVRAAIR